MRQHAETRVIKGSATYISPKLVSFWDTRRKTTLSDHITPRKARIQRTALTDKVITGLNITISLIGTILAYNCDVKCKPNPWM